MSIDGQTFMRRASRAFGSITSFLNECFLLSIFAGSWHNCFITSSSMFKLSLVKSNHVFFVL